MYRTAYYIKEVAETPGCWAELQYDQSTGIWEQTGYIYYVASNGAIIDASTGVKYDLDDFDESNNYVWRLLYEKVV